MSINVEDLEVARDSLLHVSGDIVALHESGHEIETIVAVVGNRLIVGTGIDYSGWALARNKEFVIGKITTNARNNCRTSTDDVVYKQGTSRETVTISDDNDFCGLPDVFLKSKAG